MKSVSLAGPRQLSGRRKPALLDRLARKLVTGRFARLETGRLSVTEGQRQQVFGISRAAGDVSAELHILEPSVLHDVAFERSR